MTDSTTITTRTAYLSELFRKGDVVTLTPDVDGMGTKVVVRVFDTYLTVRDVRWYDRVRWGAQRAVAWVRRGIVRLFVRATP